MNQMDYAERGSIVAIRTRVARGLCGATLVHDTDVVMVQEHNVNDNEEMREFG